MNRTEDVGKNVPCGCGKTRGRLWWIEMQQLLELCRALAAWVQARSEIEIRPERFAFVVCRVLVCSVNANR